jgi:uncharacterized protein (TIGR02246 family)
MRTALVVMMLSVALVSPAFGQQMSAADQKMMKVRQALSDKYAEAIAKKDSAAMADHYTSDAVVTSLCPESGPIVGREALMKRFEASLKAGQKDYSGKVKEVHVVGEGMAWSTGTSTSTVNDKDGNPQRLKGNWVDMLRREGGEWRVSFQAYARTPCPQ